MSRIAKISLIGVLLAFMALAFAASSSVQSVTAAQGTPITPPATGTTALTPVASLTGPPTIEVSVTVALTPLASVTPGGTIVATVGATNTALPPVATTAPSLGTAAATQGATLVATNAGGAAFDCPIPGVIAIKDDALNGTAVATSAATSAATMAGTMAATMAATMSGTMAATMQMGAAHEHSVLAKPNLQATATTVAATFTPDAEANAIYNGILNARNCTYATTLTGDQEVPGPGDTDGAGTALVSIDAATNQVCFALSASNITFPAAAAHIHRGAAGVAGPVVIDFQNAPRSIGSINVGCVTGDPAVVADIAENPAGFYVNVHTTDFPNGAVRGQLFGAVRLTGGQESPGPGAQGGIGLAGISVNTDTNAVCYAVFVRGITLPATAAHIHKAAAGTSGPVVVPFPTAPDAQGRANGCVENVDAALAEDILENPQDYYVNIHNAQFPDGAVRGQLNGIPAGATP